MVLGSSRRRKIGFASTLLVAFAVVIAVVAIRATGGAHPAPMPAATSAAVERIHTRWPIKHVVFLIKENRTFDNIFGRFPGADGATTGMMRGGKAVPLKRGYDQRTPHDLLHNWNNAISDINHGKMNGFGDYIWGRKYAYTEMFPGQAPNYWAWAKAFALSDHFFSPALGPSFPNHLFTIAAQSAGTYSNPDPPPVGSPPHYKTWGCDSPKGETVRVVDTEGNVVRVPPCFNIQTVGDLMDRRHIPWAYYASNPGEKGYIWSAFSAIRQYRDNAAQWSAHVFHVDDFVSALRAGHLPAVTWITPRFQLSEHPEYSFCHGENWTTQIVDAIMQSPEWRSTAIFITWDDWGGFYDHVPPPSVDRFGMAFRVPLLTISPYARQGFIDHRVSEFSSVLRFMEDNWGLRQLTARDQNTTDLSELFDFSRPPRPPDVLPLRTDCVGSIWSPPPPSATKFGSEQQKP